MMITGVTVLGVIAGRAALAADDLATVKAAFAHPAKEYSTAPFWVWNDMLTDEELVTTLRAFADQNVRQVFVHPRPGLMTPYLMPEWFRLWKVSLAEAEKLGMDVWIYDENSYPSGFAGGWVPEAMPESRGQGLVFREEKKPETLSDRVLAVYQLQAGVYQNVTEQARANKDLPEGDYLVARTQESSPSPWFGGKWYVDLLHPGVTEKFLDITLGAYQREIGEHLGKRVPGSFTDEPHLAPAGGLHWTGDLPAVFEKRWGYSLLDHLPSLNQPVGDWKRVRHNYYQVLLDLFIERWAKPYFDYCDKLGLEFTGHYWEHSWPETGSAPDNMAMGAWQHRPGIDILFNQYGEGPHAQFGNVRAVVELASVANQMGWGRTLCETYGGSGWDARFEDLKRIGDWVSVLGVNTINEHLSHITLRGARKGDYPISFSYQNPSWEAYHVLENYLTRVSYALTRGEQINRILVIEPTTTAWMYQGEGGGEMLGKLGDTFQKLVTDLAKAQVEFDIGCEDIIARNGSVKDNTFVVGKRAYTTVVIPPFNENLNTKTSDLLEAYLKAGGQVVSCDTAAPACVDAQPSERGAAMAQAPGWVQQAPEQAAAYLLAKAEDGFAVQRKEGDAGILYHHRRQLADTVIARNESPSDAAIYGDILFLVNTSIEHPTAGTVESPFKGVEQWDLNTGEVSPYPCVWSADGVKAEFTLPPSGSLLLFLSKQAGAAAPAASGHATLIAASGGVQVEAADLNVLTLDYVDVSAGGETLTASHFYRAAEFVFKKHGMNKNPWDHSVQYRDELISKTFPADSGFEASYRFVIEGQVPKTLYAVVESSERYAITCNGAPVAAPAGSWWLDRAFGKIDIAAAAVVGENVVTIKAGPFTMFHEVAPAYVVGEFSLKATDQGFVIVPAAELQLGPWKEQGWPLYGAGVTYTMQFPVKSVAGRYRVRLPEWYGAVAKVTVNGKLAGYAYGQPTECDVTDAVTAGNNSIAVTVIGTLKNTLGPHHDNPPLGIASPGSFSKGPETGPPAGASYSTLEYGLFAPFVLEQTN
jgi:hypothetical protein